MHKPLLSLYQMTFFLFSFAYCFHSQQYFIIFIVFVCLNVVLSQWISNLTSSPFFFILESIIIRVLPNWTLMFQLHIFQVKVVDRTAVVTANAETEVVKPPGIQEAINAETGMQPMTPAFSRLTCNILMLNLLLVIYVLNFCLDH